MRTSSKYGIFIALTAVILTMGFANGCGKKHKNDNNNDNVPTPQTQVNTPSDEPSQDNQNSYDNTNSQDNQEIVQPDPYAYKDPFERKLSHLLGYDVYTGFGNFSEEEQQIVFEQFQAIAHEPSVVGKDIDSIQISNRQGESYVTYRESFEDSIIIFMVLRLGSLKTSDDILNFFESITNEDIANMRRKAQHLRSLDQKLSKLMGYNVTTYLLDNSDKDRQQIYERLFPIANSSSIHGKDIEYIHVYNSADKSQLNYNENTDTTILRLYLGSLKTTDDILDFFDSITNEDIANLRKKGQHLRSLDQKLSKLMGYNVTTNLLDNSDEDRQQIYKQLSRIANSPIVVGKNIHDIEIYGKAGESYLDYNKYADTIKLKLYLGNLKTTDDILNLFQSITNEEINKAKNLDEYVLTVQPRP